MSRLTGRGIPPSVSNVRDRTPLLWAGGTVFDVVLDGSQTGGALSFLDQRGAHGDTTPMHVHRDEAEVFYVLDGEITAWFEDEVLTLATGAAVYLPPGRPHALGISGDHARILTLTTGGGFADFVRAAGAPAPEGVPSRWDFDVSAVVSAAPAHGIEIVGPPPSLPTGAGPAR